MTDPNLTRIIGSATAAAGTWAARRLAASYRPQELIEGAVAAGIRHVIETGLLVVPEQPVPVHDLQAWLEEAADGWVRTGSTPSMPKGVVSIDIAFGWKEPRPVAPGWSGVDATFTARLVGGTVLTTTRISRSYAHASGETPLKRAAAAAILESSRTIPSGSEG